MLEKETIFWFSALAGSSLFLIQLLFNFSGLDMDDHDHSAQDFKWISKQALTGFLMMFGWSGLTARKEFYLSPWLSIAVALVVGFIAMLITACLFHLAKKLRSTGTVFNLDEAIGKQASIYQKIPKGGIGKVSLALQNMTFEIDAISENQEEIDSFSQVQIIRKADEQTVVVVPIK